MDIKIISTQCATSAGTAMSGDALGLRALVFNNPIATDAFRIKGDFVGFVDDWEPDTDPPAFVASTRSRAVDSPI